jgi:hypothetical protein
MPRITIRVITVALVLVAGLLIAGGLMYLRDPAHALPSFLPGHSVRSSKHHITHGLVLITLAALALGAAWLSTAPVLPGDSRR